MRIAVAAVAALFITPAAAQVAQDCNGTAFLLRSFPREIVMNGVVDHMKDPENTRFGTIAGRCERPGEMTVVCGYAFRMSRSGYVSDKVLFYGIYKDTKFVYLGTGPKAQFVCRKEISEHMPL